LVAARSLPDPAAPVAGAGLTSAGGADPIAALAQRWAALTPDADAMTAARLGTVLRRLATALRAEPFWPLTARGIGEDLPATGLCGQGTDPADAAQEVLPATMRLLRHETPAVLGVSGAECERRLATALDELAAGFAGALLDLRERVDLPRAHRREREEAERAGNGSHHRTAYTHAAVGMGIASLDGRVLDINPALGRMFGLDCPLDQPRPVTDFVHPDDAAVVIERYQRLARGEPDVVRLDMRFVRPDELVLWAHVVASLVRDGGGRPDHLVVVVEDVSERYRLRSRLRQASYRDELTRLPNRSMTEQLLHRSFSAGESPRVGLCALDLDGFTAVNDGLGHQAGDQLLVAVAGRLQMAAGRHVVTRTGGDEFAVLVTDPGGVGDVTRLADRVLAALATPFLVGGHALTVSASIGIAEATTGSSCPGELMRAAAVALSWAKAHGGGRRVVFDPERDAGQAARFALLAGLRGGVDRDEFRLDFQPLVRLADRRVAGVEALVRWEHPTQGLVGPGQFIEPAEQSGAIVPLGRWVLREACARAAGWWHELGPVAPYVSVNVSPVQLRQPGWVHEVTEVLRETGLPPDRLQLEITEKAVLGDETAALDALTALRAAGVRLALDDFGTGYSSLAWLRRLPVHALKIDGSFIDGLRHPAAEIDASIVRALVEMAHALGLEVTAEWVETAEQARRLAHLGCDSGQGRWFGDAGPAEWVPGICRRNIGGRAAPSAESSDEERVR
jgi:diguanylate cyclase (GGDEF)-like protein/PAS domain S-box-containing protein